MSSPIAGLARPFRHTVVRAALALAMAVALLGAPASAKPVAAADAWYDGGITESVIVNCGSIIWGNPYLEYGAGVFVGYLADPGASKPAPNQTYYIRIYVSGLGNSCSGQWAWPQLVLPKNTSLATGSPMYCLYDNVPQGICPTTAALAGSFNSVYGGYSINPTSGSFWGLPQGHNWEFQIPVTSSSTLTSEIFGAKVVMADGNDNPTLVATQNVFVFSGTANPTPVIQYPTPSTTEITRTTAKSYANIYTGGVAGYVRFQLGTTTAYSLYNSDPYYLSAGTANWNLYDDWTPTVLTPDTLYHFRMWFDQNGNGIVNAGDAVGVDQTFRTAGAATHFNVAAPGSIAGGSATSITVTALDASNAVVNNYRGTVTFSTTDASGVTPGNHAFTAGDNGTATITGLRFATAGSQTVTAQDTTNPAVKGSASVNVTSSAVKPTASMTSLSSWRASTSIPLAWNGTGTTFDVLSQRAAYNGTFGNYALYKNNVTGKSASFTAAAGSTYCFRARSTAASGIASDLTTATCTAIPLDERSATRSSGWTKGTGSSYYKSTYLKTTTKGARLTRTGVKAKRVAIVAQTCATCGKVSVYMGSTLLKTVSLASTKTRNKVIIPIYTYPSVKSGTLSIKVITSGKKVLIDGIVISAR